jgi:hypothetical protein
MRTLGGLLSLLAAVPASACSCIDFPTPSEELVRSDAAFAGKVTSPASLKRVPRQRPRSASQHCSIGECSGFPDVCDARAR